MNNYGSTGSLAYTYEELLFFIETELTSGAESLLLEYPGDSPFSTGSVVRDGGQQQSIAFGAPRAIGGFDWSRRYWEDLDDYINLNCSGDSRLRSILPAAVNVRGSEVVLIERHVAERARQGLTLEAMHSGADVIVAGQLAIGQFAGLVDMLVKEPGGSEFGDYYYMPCGIDYGDKLYAALRLCFFADLLQNMQGSLSSDLLLFHCEATPEILDTEEYIQYFRALKYRFITSRNNPAAEDGTRLKRAYPCERPPGHSYQGGDRDLPLFGDGGEKTWSPAAVLDEVLGLKKLAGENASIRTALSLQARRQLDPAIEATGYIDANLRAIVSANEESSGVTALAPQNEKEWTRGFTEATT